MAILIAVLDGHTSDRSAAELAYALGKQRPGRQRGPEQPRRDNLIAPVNGRYVPTKALVRPPEIVGPF